MMEDHKGGKRVRWRWVVLGLVIVSMLFLLWWNLRGRGIRMRFTHRLKAILNQRGVERHGDFSNVVFLHHSVGRHLIDQGQMRQQLTAAGFELWDHGYNWERLNAPDGTRTGYSYVIPGDNTDPDGLARLFSQRLYSWPINAFSGLMQHEVIVFKSCFPNSNITSDAQLEQYRSWYRGMRDVMDQHPDHVFIVVTPPPLNPAATTPEAAERARAFANWLSSQEFLAGHPNIFTFDLFDALAESDPAAPDANMLREAYREGEDSHPNTLANETIGARFADFIVTSVESYRGRLTAEGEGP